MAGINRALRENRHIAKWADADSRPCIFLSHISVDISSAAAVANYIMNEGDFDVYLDIHDTELATAVQAGNAAAITSFIERGLVSSTHIMCLVTANTIRSWWVPYELGFAKKAGKHLSTLLLKGKIDDLPPYLKISEVIAGTRSLNEFLSRIKQRLAKTASTKELSESLISHTANPHPLDRYLEWDA
jgi:hypothetical protein